MGSIIILLMTMAMLLYFFRTIWISRRHLIKYLSTVGENTPINQPKLRFTIPFLIVHGIIGLFVGYMVYLKESEGRVVFRILLSFIVALVLIMLLLAFYFITTIIIKEIIYMKDWTINYIFIYSFISCIVIFIQIFTGDIEYPKGLLWFSAVLYTVNLFSIGRFLWTIFKKKVLVKSIWSIPILNFSFAVIALSNFVYGVQRVLPYDCYSRTINSWGDALYYVVISFFTVGYGDLYPTCETTKILSMVIVATGFSFSAVFVSTALSATIEHFSNIVKK